MSQFTEKKKRAPEVEKQSQKAQGQQALTFR